MSRCPLVLSQCFIKILMWKLLASWKMSSSARLVALQLRLFCPISPAQSAPALADNTCPPTNDAASESKNKITSAISIGFATLYVSNSRFIQFPSSPLSARFRDMGVSTSPCERMPALALVLLVCTKQGEEHRREHTRSHSIYPHRRPIFRHCSRQPYDCMFRGTVRWHSRNSSKPSTTADVHDRSLVRDTFLPIRFRD
jgi:hypothetical protein